MVSDGCMGSGKVWVGEFTVRMDDWKGWKGENTGS